MKVLHVVRALDVGGLERVVLDLVEGCKSHGIESHIVCLHYAGAWGEGRDNLVVLSGNSKIAKAISLARLARKMGVDVLHSHNPEPHLVAVLAGLLTRTPVVHTKHGRNYPKSRRRVWLNRTLAMCSSTMVAVSDEVARVAKETEGVGQGGICVIPNGIDVGRFNHGRHGRHGNQEEIREKLGLPPKGIIIGSVGRLAIEKNYALLIGAFSDLCHPPFRLRGAYGGHAALRPPPSDLRLLLVGDGDQRDPLIAVAEKADITEHCRFVGNQDNVPEWLEAMDIFCLSSNTEGLSVTLLEACASGLPSVVTDVGGNSEVVTDGASGFVVPPGDQQAMSDALLELVLNVRLREKMGRFARDDIESRYSLGQTVKAYIETYKRVIVGSSQTVESGG